MPIARPTTLRCFSDAARVAAAAARKAKREGREAFGSPALFIVRAGERSYNWELRRFGGVILEAGAEPFASVGSARHAGAQALSRLIAAEAPTAAERDRRPASQC